ncbi:ankyrin repeat-containing domain protein [Phaeosphaeriaceae sp. PMI808]|nr:ankyrin repeat-containing domain protein [Phaeosphaeriaceae sp. PMI808]
MASPILYREARTQFIQDARTQYKSGRDLDILQDFLVQNGTPEDARATAQALKEKAGDKWGSKKIGDTEIPAAWIDRLMENIGNFVAVGDYAMKGAPESVGLAWFAVKLTLSAIQSNYDLYSFFGSALTDISDIMIIIAHFDRLYDERSKATSDNKWKPSPVVEKLFRDIILAYVGVLNFSFSVRRYLGAGTLEKIGHGFQDFFGTSKSKFEGKIATIASHKKQIIEDSQAVFQDKTLHQIDVVQNILRGIEGTVDDIKSFHSTFEKMREEQNAQLALVLTSMEDIKTTMKPKTSWDLALQKFDRNKDALSPQKDTSAALADAIDQRHPGTCQWIVEHSSYVEWKTSTANSMLCATGKTPSAKTVCNTLLYLLYDHARKNKEDIELLEDCNKVFIDPKEKEKNRSNIITNGNKAATLPEFADAFIAIAKRLGMNVIVALDEVDSLSVKDQQELATKLKAILAPPKAFTNKARPTKVLVGCRSSSGFSNQMFSAGSLLWSVDVGECNGVDMKKQLVDDLKNVPGLTQAEKEEAIDAILKRAGTRFAYIGTIAVPFMREPFRRPLSSRLHMLPEGMDNLYNEALRKMSSNYVELLRVALTWTLLAPIPLRVDEVMDIYHGTYTQRGLNTEHEARAIVDAEFTKTSELDIQQLQDARGPFLKLEVEPWSGQHFIHLQDPPQIRDFCLNTSDTSFEEKSTEAHVCARCMATGETADVLSISPKEGHLKLALECLRTMNNPVFQRRMTSWDEVPLWSQQTAPAQSLKIKVATKEETSKSAEADTTPETSNFKEDRSLQIGEGKGDAGKAMNGDIKQNGADQQNDTDSTEEEDSEDPDDIQDDEDRNEENVKDDLDGLPNVRLYRYELQYWSYHMRQAENLWSPEERSKSSDWAELFNELDEWVSKNAPWFSRWQLLSDKLARHKGLLKPLHVAAYLGLTSWASHLLAKGADINEAPYELPQTPLHLAASRADCPAMLKLLLENGADPNIEINELPCPCDLVHTWLKTNSDIESVQLFVKHGANPTMVDQHSKWTALHYIAWQGKDVAALELLLNHAINDIRPNINAPDCFGSLPLHIILLRREVPKALLQAFLDHGADVNKDNKFSSRPLQFAGMFGDLEALQILCHTQAVTEVDDLDVEGNSALQLAAVFNHIKCVKFLVELGANPNIENKFGRVALHTSAWKGTKQCVEVLLSHGALPNTQDKHNRTPLFFACLDKSTEEKAILLLDMLLEKNVPLAEINAATKHRRTPLREAAGHGFEYVVDKLIKTAGLTNDFASLALNEKDTRKGMTPLHRAARLGRVGCVRLLLAADADVTICDNNGKTPLVLTYEQWTLSNHQQTLEDIISCLIDKDPKTAAADAELVAVCATNGSTRLLQQLIMIGADLNRQDKYGWTPLALAQNALQEDTVCFLKQQAAWAGMLPSQVCISTYKPLPAGLDTFYFEATITTLAKNTDGLPDKFPILAIGFCTIGGSAIRFPGFPARIDAPSARSWGYHGDDGGLYHSDREDGQKTATELRYGIGHTVGCGVDLTTQTMWFTRNGQRLQGEFTGVRGRLFPLLGLKGEVEVKTNFAGPFLWKSDVDKGSDEAESKAAAYMDVHANQQP